MVVTGNTVIDALTWAAARPASYCDPVFGGLDTHPGPVLLVTAHRRESFGLPFASICAAIERLAQRGDVEIVFPRHPNPALDGAAGRLRNLPPQNLPDFVRLMRGADLVLFSAHPLSTYTTVEKTFIEGQIYFDRELDLKTQPREVAQ